MDPVDQRTKDGYVKRILQRQILARNQQEPHQPQTEQQFQVKQSQLNNKEFMLRTLFELQ